MSVAGRAIAQHPRNQHVSQIVAGQRVRLVFGAVLPAPFEYTASLRGAVQSAGAQPVRRPLQPPSAIARQARAPPHAVLASAREP